MTHSIVRPTAFFKSLGGQVESCRKGGPYVMFGGGELASCKPISEADLARFMADCLRDEDKRNRVLPIGGPGPALSAKQQGEMLFRALGRPAPALGSHCPDGRSNRSAGGTVPTVPGLGHRRIRTYRAVLRR